MSGSPPHETLAPSRTGRAGEGASMAHRRSRGRLGTAGALAAAAVVLAGGALPAQAA
ncbi:S8 family peptidase, partial [Streptomyces botrytidirepellens]